MSHAEETVLAIRDELRAQGFMVSECCVVGDDPIGDFGIAWTLGIWDGCEHFRYDVGYLPTRHTIIHEFGHDMHGKWQAQGMSILEGFWAAGGFRLSIAESLAAANVYGDQGNAYQQWRRFPHEILADFFAWTVLGDFVQTETWGGLNESLEDRLSPELRARLITFFQSFTEEETEMTPAQMAEIKAYIDTAVAGLRDRIAHGEVTVTSELVGALNSGFNTTLPVELVRLARGHDPREAGNDGRITAGESLYPTSAR